MSYISEKILDILKNGVADTSFIIDAMFSTRPESYRKLRASLRGIPCGSFEKVDRIEARKENQKLYSILNHLKKEGFIRKEKNKTNEVWAITKAGINKLNFFNKLATTSKNDVNYSKGKIKSIIIVAFDIPERLRHYRAWVREVLKYLGFSMVQQSVWVGNCKIPEQFISDLEKRKILNCVDIFEVGNKGTLERIVFQDNKKSGTL